MAARWESNDSSHRAIVRDADDFNSGSFRRKKADKGVEMVLGKHKSNDSVLKVQSFVFDREVFETQSDAKRWYQDNGEKHDKEYDSRAGTALDSKDIKQLGGINKRLMSVQRQVGEEGEVAGVQTPTDEQLTLINQYTRTPKSADQLAVFPVMACNDVIDRDLDQFTTETVSGFMDLQGPLSPLGKSFMVGHDYRSLPVGRIFDGGAVKEGNITWLRLWTYIPNTPQYHDYLENVDFGVYWAVSVGVMLNGSECSVGEPHDWGWHPWVCSQMHMKGERYQPDGEVDRFGMPIPDESGVLCYRKLMEPADFYELSQVYLGAQYMAELDKSANKLLAKGAGGRNLEVATLSVKEADKLPSVPGLRSGTRPAAAVDAGLLVERLPNGEFKWTDQQGLVWVHDPSTNEDACLGRSAQEPGYAGRINELRTLASEAREAAKQLEGEDAEEAASLLDSLDTSIAEAISALEEEDFDTANSTLEGAQASVERLRELALGEAEEEPEEEAEAEPTLDNMTEEAEDVDKAAVVKAARAAKLPTPVLEQLEAAKDNGLEALMAATSQHIEGLNTQLAAANAKAALGDAYLGELRADAIHWYTMSKRDPADPAKGVGVERMERLLDLCGDNVELIKEQIEMHKDLAKAKFPEAVRRSTFPESPNERRNIGGEDRPSETSQHPAPPTGVARIHR